MYGGDGNDSYYVDAIYDTRLSTAPSDKVIEFGGQGTDRVYSSVSTTYEWLPANVENLTLTGTALWGHGNSLSNSLSGNDVDNDLSGLGGNDTLYGNGGNDRVDGGVGGDTMYGGTGNDQYHVDTILDRVIEFEDEGKDHIVSSLRTSYMPAHTESMTIVDTAYEGHGNDSDNTLFGNPSANALYGHGGNDTIYGGFGPWGDMSGSDIIDGGAGADTMYGEDGNDWYYVDTILDKVIELGGQGTDHVYSSVSTNYKWLPANVENLTLTGTAYHGDGNDLNNSIYGNASANSLWGYGGNDWLYGYGGNDYLYGGVGNDTLNGGTGVDTLNGGGGNDRLRGEADNDRLYGEAGIDTLNGGAGWDNLNGGTDNDYLDGGTGPDTITGGSGDDRFDFSDVDEYDDFPGATIKDYQFKVGNIGFNDNIGLQAQAGAGEAFSAGLSFTGALPGISTLKPSYYFEERDPYDPNAPSGIYMNSVDDNTGRLYYNPTSNIGDDATWLATVDVVGTNVSALSAADFVLI
jgi:Ca2+-binding RTX toxin-like protein